MSERPPGRTYEPGEHVPVPDGSPRTTDPLHEALQMHLESCEQCREASVSRKAKGFGQKSSLCPKYFELVEFFGKGVEL